MTVIQSMFQSQQHQAITYPLSSFITLMIADIPMAAHTQSYNKWLFHWMSHMTGVSERVRVPPAARTVITPLVPSNWLALLKEHP